MKPKENKTNEVVQHLKNKVSKLPVGFIVGVAAGGGLLLYATRNRGSKTTNAITNLAKLAAPYVIIAILDKFADSYDQKQDRVIEDVELDES
ncbi:MAG: hypothetical protein ACK5KP_06815 [Paludibacteraceae bacterium]